MIDRNLSSSVTTNQSRFVSIQEIINIKTIVSQKNNTIRTDLDVTPFRHAQLLTVERSDSIFNSIPMYHLRIYPYWAVKIIGYDANGLMNYSDDIKEWLVSCYIFYRYESWGDDLQSFFDDLLDKGLLDYAVFCAQKAGSVFIHGLKKYLLGVETFSPRLCYAILRLTDQCPLSIADKFDLFVHIADKIVGYGLIDFYSRVLERVLAVSEKPSSLRRNMRSLVPCRVKDINHINGYKAGAKYMDLIGKQTVFDLVWIIVQYTMQNHMEEIIEGGENESYLDFFLRKCLEHYIVRNEKTLRDVYIELNKLFKLSYPFGAYVKRNLTCAAGNIFENHGDELFQEEYIDTARWFTGAHDLYDRLTAWYLISNSIGSDDEELAPELKGILMEIMKDQEIMERVGEKIKDFLKRIYR